MIERYDLLDFERFGVTVDGEPLWEYKIFTEGCYPYDDGVVRANDYYESEQEARFAAIGHITNLLNPDV
jgi:hypothetical protein